ncbi:MAG: hypothetical protein M5U16_08125 [Hyphomicrobium sp.]|nr:hypothetical protein [Hyphomicrobium sp.]
MITIEMVMLAALGFLTAALLALFIAPLYRRRVARLTTEMLKRSMPLTEAEIRADKDRLRAEFAIRIHKLETKVEEAAEASARQMVELNRRDATISELEGEVAGQRTALEEHENARRVLEQTIMDRLPKVEHRLAEARKLLFQRDREIVSLTQSSEKQARALEEATQINTQQTDEVHRLKAALNTRAARNREGFGDPRYDGEVALRTEIEALRAKTREQTALIARLQSLVARAGPAAEAGDGAGVNGSGDAMRPAKVVGRGKSAAEAPPPLKAVENPPEGPDPQALAEIRRLKSVNQDQAAELSRLKAALATYEAADNDDRGIKESKIAMKARLSALKALTDEQAGTIQALRAELAAGNEKLARQAAYFMEEMRRLGSGTMPASGPARRSGVLAPEAGKRPLAERINDPRVARFVRPGGEGDTAAAADTTAAEPRRVGGFLKALDAAALPAETRVEHAPAAEASGAGADSTGTEIKRTRKARLLDRITGLDKNSA